jgi:hypothetical protein
MQTCFRSVSEFSSFRFVSEKNNIPIFRFRKNNVSLFRFARIRFKPRAFIFYNFKSNQILISVSYHILHVCHGVFSKQIDLQRMLNIYHLNENNENITIFFNENLISPIVNKVRHNKFSQACHSTQT